MARDKNKANDRHEIVIVILTNRTFMEYHEYEIKMIDEIGINKVKIYENERAIKQKILEKGIYDGSCKTNYKTDKRQQ